MVFLCWNITTVVRAVYSTRENQCKIRYQMVPRIVLMVILPSFGTKVFKKGVLVYGFPLFEYVFFFVGISQQQQKDYTLNVKIGTRFVTNWYLLVYGFPPCWNMVFPCWNQCKIKYQMVPRIVLMVILLSFGTKVFKEGVLVYDFPLLEYHYCGYSSLLYT